MVLNSFRIFLKLNLYIIKGENLTRDTIQLEFDEQIIVLTLYNSL